MLARFASVALLAGAANAAFSIVSPSSSTWWVANSVNTLTWDCHDSSAAQNFTILLKSPTSPQPQAIIAIENNFVCSQLLTQEQVTMPAAQGYQILFANPLNATQVYTTSDSFEIKPVGSAYPTTTPTPDGGGPTSAAPPNTASGTASAGAASASQSASGGKSGAGKNALSAAVLIGSTILGVMLA